MVSKKPLRIALTGPESTGKSMLCQQLAEYFNEPWVPEYSREYLSDIGADYNFGDILAIAHGQFERESIRLKDAKQYLFCDTDFMVTHIWCMVKYGKSHDWITNMAANNPYNYTLLCNIDIPWESDPLRENPNDRDYILDLYKKELTVRGIPYSIVEGTGAERFNNAVKLLAEQGISP